MDPSILKELRHLVDANVISEETANQIQEYYRSRKTEPSNRFTIVLSILGALLVGLGIVLVIAHNWDDFSRLLKTIFAFLPLVLGQGLCLYALLRRKDSFVWRECSAIILFFGIGASIALVSQIYHMGGELSDLLLVWMVLSAPLIYLLPSYIVSLLYIAGVSWYACVLGYSWDSSSKVPYLYLPLMLVIVPAYLKLLRTKNNLFVLHNWFLAASVVFVLGAFTRETDYQWVFLGYLSLGCIYYHIGTGSYFAEQRLYANPFRVLSLPGIVAILLFWSYQYTWSFNIFGDAANWDWIFFCILLLLFLVAAGIMIRRYTRKERLAISPVEFSAYVFLVALLLETNDGMLSAIVINLWVLLLGLYFTRLGSIRSHLGILNLGLFIIGLLAVLRFFDESIPFVWRGIFFLATGITFFAANYIVIKRRKSLAIMKDQQL